MHLVSESAEDDAGVALVLNWVLNWLAYPLQHPGAKMASALVFHGPQGTGKNLFFEAYKSIFGQYGTVIGQSQIESKYNDWAIRKLCVIGDEISAPKDQANHKNSIKAMVTGEDVQIDEKFQPLRTESNHANFVFLSNDPKPLALERDDRRFMVIWCPPKLTDGLYERVAQSIHAGAVEAFYDFLMRRDLGTFDCHTQPVMTTAKADLIGLGLRPAERFAKAWLAGDIDLPLHPCSTGQLYRAFSAYCHTLGERKFSAQQYFSSTVVKYARGHLSTYKASPSPHEAGSTIALWLPAGTGPNEGVRWFDFAKGCLAAFEAPLSDFCSGPQNGVL
jgi:putative DNA primase/helicase